MRESIDPLSRVRRTTVSPPPVDHSIMEVETISAPARRSAGEGRGFNWDPGSVAGAGQKSGPLSASDLESLVGTILGTVGAMFDARWASSPVVRTSVSRPRPARGARRRGQGRWWR